MTQQHPFSEQHQFSEQHSFPEQHSFLSSPITIKGSQINNRLFLAPMAGLGNVAFRELVAEFGGFGLLFTGMCSAKAVPQENRNISTVFKWRDEELPFLVCQIFGSEPKTMAIAAKRVEKEGFFGVDLNFGCCASAICKKGCGAALLKEPTLAKEIVNAVRQSVSIPIFVKFRTGWDNHLVNEETHIAKMAASFADAGADALVFHPRMAPDRRLRPPKWEDIKLVKDAVSIPVFGNGNIFEALDCEKMLNVSNCDGVSIGRMALAKPWIFATLSRGFSPNTQAYISPNTQAYISPNTQAYISPNTQAYISPNTQAYIAPNTQTSILSDDNIYRYTAMRMITLLIKHYDERTAVKFFKKFAPYYAAGFKFGHSISKQLLEPDTTDEIRKAIDTIFSKPPETISQPNLHLFL